MEITGIDYIFLSNRDQAGVVEEFIRLVKKKWSDPVIDGYQEFLLNPDERIDLFFEKDKAMTVEDISYTINSNGEGCFQLLSHIYDAVDFKIIVQKEITPGSGGFMDKDPYEARMIMNRIYEYTLVLPGPIDEYVFCNDIYSYLLKILNS